MTRTSPGSMGAAEAGPMIANRHAAMTKCAGPLVAIAFPSGPSRRLLFPVRPRYFRRADNRTAENTAETSNPLVGTWKLEAFQIEFENHERQDAYDQPCGSLIITPDGRMLAIVADNGRQLNDPSSSLFDRMMAYSGPCHVSDDCFTTDVDVAWHPSWLGTKQTRYFKIEGDMLSIITPPGSIRSTPAGPFAAS